MKRIAALAALVVLVVPLTSHASDARRLVAEDLRRIAEISSPTISADGSRIAFIESHVIWDSDTTSYELRLIDVKTRAIRTLTYDRKDPSDPAFSPDGTKLAFLADAGSDDDARTQIWVMPLDGGDARPVSKAPEGVEQFAWRPDGGAFAYAAEDEEPKRSGADRYRDSFVFTTEPITARAEPRPVHLFVIPAVGGATRKLTNGTTSVTTGQAQSTLSWSPDGSHIAFLSAPNAIFNDADRAHVDVLDVAAATLAQLTAHTGYEADPRFSPDGTHVAYIHSAGDPQVNLSEAYVTGIAGGDGIALSHPFDRMVQDYAWAPDSRALYFTCADKTRIALVHATLAGAFERVELGDVVIESPLAGAIAQDGTIAFAGSDSRTPAELYVRASNGTVTKLTTENATFAALALGATQTIEFPTSLGIMADAKLIEPPGFKAGIRYPLVLVIHGGPTGSSDLSFDRLGQRMAARGWLVLEPNYRGSNNLGLAFQRGVLYDPDDGPGKDIMAAVDAVRALRIVNEKRIAVSGWSYGGIMTAWMISKYHIWRAAVSGASVDDWATDYGTADDSDLDVALFHGSPFTGDAAEWRRASAISYARDVTTPVLILSDVGDNRDTFASSSMYWRALRDNHKDATLRVWPVNGHHPHDPVRLADIDDHWIDYIARHFSAP